MMIKIIVCGWPSSKSCVFIHPLIHPSVCGCIHLGKHSPNKEPSSRPSAVLLCLLQVEPGTCPAQIRDSQAQEAVSLDSSGLDSESRGGRWEVVMKGREGDVWTSPGSARGEESGDGCEEGSLECLLHHVSFFNVLFWLCLFFFKLKQFLNLAQFTVIIISIGFYSINYLYLILFYKLWSAL